MSDEEKRLIRATMEGYVAALLESRPNPYAYVTSEAWAWQHGYEQGRLHSIRTTVATGNCPMPFPGYDRKCTL